MKSDRGRRVLLDCLLVALLGTSLVAGASGFKKSFYDVFKWSKPTIPQSMKDQVAHINTIVPESEPVFFIKEDPDLWTSRVWQRALYPRRVFLISSAAELNSLGYSQMKKEYSVRYALWAGTPALDKPFIRTWDVGPLGPKERLVLGELAR